MCLHIFSLSRSLGNSVNIAGKNRYLNANLLLQTEKYLDGTSDASQRKAAMNGLQSNIITLKQEGMISGVDLKPLPSDLTSGILLIDCWRCRIKVGECQRDLNFRIWIND